MQSRATTTELPTGANIVSSYSAFLYSAFLIVFPVVHGMCFSFKERSHRAAVVVKGPPDTDAVNHLIGKEEYCLGLNACKSFATHS